MARVVLERVVKRYGKVLAVDDLTLECAHHEFLAILGPSGCGKSSTMRMVAGLEEITEGTISIGDQVVNDLPPAARNVAMAFEHYGLYPHMSVFDNIAYPLRVARVPTEEMVRSVLDVVRMLRIEPFLERRPRALSGGVRQRVSLARALVRRPSVFLLDEPISHLEAELRNEMRIELKRLHAANDSTTIYVTHDQLEALTMADRVAIMHQGGLQQVGTPEDVYRRPANRFVATFVGEPPMNIVQASVNGGRVAVGDYALEQVAPGTMAAIESTAGGAGGTVDVGVRPDDFRLWPGRAGHRRARTHPRESGGHDAAVGGYGWRPPAAALRRRACGARGRDRAPSPQGGSHSLLRRGHGPGRGTNGRLRRRLNNQEKGKAQFAKCRHGLAIAASRQALGDGWSPSSMRWNHLR